MQKLNVKRLAATATLPTRGTNHSAGYDLYAHIAEPLTIPARGKAVVSTGIAIEIDSGFAGFIFARSGLGIKHGIAPSNCVGVIDSDYRGEVKVGLTNSTDIDYTISPNDRIAQLIIMPYFAPEIIEVAELNATDRDDGGFGSTGK